MGISDEIAAVRDLMVTEFNKLNREVAGLNTKVAALHKQLQHMALSFDDNNTNDKTVLYTSSTLDITTAEKENEKTKEKSEKFSPGSSTGTRGEDCEEYNEPAEDSKSSSSRKSHRRKDSFMSTVSNDAEELASTRGTRDGLSDVGL
ncbi:hypothetical protein Pmar_PMAR018980 [Perkinsus marinus ATCC 50983]|uniref:Uncharacterized protein n=1 Tax=Perkinsus marinus (strain ATCC 50983 / TXsc) TaxID=423536 RepID=C5KXZ6_PERM5|nr:hypothetical protein Pmar_PMAR018980 [Perkinsus marinus ATCC 50983]EER10603.1 hypothetical protein Pmar_PMAR018980 [Perkinsus marinus ATCC 50983]|eukprot:XP_002778808.1 hypothetical protein Pmar_PMAR018980 [Perkinsus marinus ATCC 50983]